jgi:hypothetical protein
MSENINLMLTDDIIKKIKKLHKEQFFLCPFNNFLIYLLGLGFEKALYIEQKAIHSYTEVSNITDKKIRDADAFFANARKRDVNIHPEAVNTITGEYNRICAFLHENNSIFRPDDLHIKEHSKGGVEALLFLFTSQVLEKSAALAAEVVNG